VLLLGFTLAAVPAWAQATGPLVSPQPPVQPYATPVLGVQPSVQAPGPGVAPPVPPPPSQSHLPAPSQVAGLTAATPFELHPSLTFSEEYSDNFLISSTNKVDNFRSIISPGLLVGINGPKTRGTLSTSLGVAQDSSVGGFSFFPTLSAAVKHAFDPRLSLSLADTFTRSDEPALANQFGLQQQRQAFTSNTLSLSADWLLDLLTTQGYYQLSTFSSSTNTVSQILGADAGIPLGPLMAAKAGYEFFHSSISGASSNDSTGHLIWASVARQIGPLRSVGVSTSYSFQSLDSTSIWNVSLFNAYELPGRLSLSGSLGYSVLSSDSGGNFSAISSNTSASYRLARAVISVALLRDFNQTFLQGQNFGVVLTRSYTGSFAYALTPFIDTTLRASYSENEFTGVGNSQSSPDTKTFSAQASLAWRLQRWLTMGLDYTYTRYNSVATVGGAAIENRVALRLTASF